MRKVQWIMVVTLMTVGIEMINSTVQIVKNDPSEAEIWQFPFWPVQTKKERCDSHSDFNLIVLRIEKMSPST